MERWNWVAPSRDMNPYTNGKSLQSPVGDFLTMQIKEHGSLYGKEFSRIERNDASNYSYAKGDTQNTKD